MREYRGKCNGVWIYGYYVYSEFSRHHLIMYNDKDGLMKSKEIDHNTIGQYTGLKDKNDVKIFEGDELEIYYYIDDNTTNKQIWFTRFVTVVFSNDDVHYGYYGITDIGDYYQLNNYGDRRVIGNIHDKGVE